MKIKKIKNKIFLLGIVSIFLTAISVTPVKAQVPPFWLDSGSDIYSYWLYASTDNSVGIGTTNADGLQINLPVNETARGVDNIRVGTIGSARLILEDAGYSQWEFDNYNGRFRIYTPGVEKFTIKDNGNVGISIGDPNFKLDIGGVSPAININFASVQNVLDIDNGYKRSLFGSNLYWDSATNFWKTRTIGGTQTDFAAITHENNDGLMFYARESTGSTPYSIATSGLLNYLAMAIKNDGKVSIGGGYPTANLSVYGTIGSTGSSGTVVIPYVSTTGPKSFDISFPIAYSSPPNVIVTHYNSGTGNLNISRSYVKNTTTTGFTLRFDVESVTTPGTTKFNWIAIEP